MASDKDWIRAGEAIQARREEVGYRTQESLAAALGSTVKWVNNIENARHAPYRKTYVHQLERLLKWDRGSVDRILDGGEPVELPVPAPKESPLTRKGSAQLVAEITERLTVLVSRIHDDPPILIAGRDGVPHIHEMPDMWTADIPPFRREDDGDQRKAGG